MIINKEHFYNNYRLHFGKLSQSQVEGLELILDVAMSYDRLTLEQIAYILATARHESANTYQPIKERRASRVQVRIRRMQDRYWHTGYYGRGLVQITWYRNYKQFSDLLDVNLVNNPDLALDSTISVKILFLGMMGGLFTGKKLRDYINDKKVDYYNARRIVNGTFKAKAIAQEAKLFEKCLREATDGNN